VEGEAHAEAGNVMGENEIIYEEVAEEE